MQVVWSSGFTRSFKKITKRNPQIGERIIEVLMLLAEDPFTPSLKSHKLTGNLEGLWSCSVAYDCRIVFEFSEEDDVLEIFILLVNVGTHDKVY
ncbi:type II toxin-antitoxin system YafQ family toxin [Chamaesiphon sp. GL140_3_metabinner_50]|uniref:type II toxin-antitoxin system RelE/ParE family toxin n=1 Tax=Chamaesiphon sp. GL140_3_metabinner_50 TaxID=2970812 RepID=UPI0034594E39